MKIILMCEGKTEVALKLELKRLIDEHCQSEGPRRVGLVTRQFEGRTPTRELAGRLREYARQQARDKDILGVVALTDVYPDYQDAAHAKESLIAAARGADPPAGFFHAHAAQFEVEAWAIPFWEEITRRLRVNARPPGANPERINSMKPPSKHFEDLYARAKKKYEKPIELVKNLKGRIEEAAKRCPELRKLLDTLISLCNKQANTES